LLFVCSSYIFNLIKKINLIIKLFKLINEIYLLKLIIHN